MERRILAGAVVTAVVVVGGAIANFALDVDLVAVILLAGLVGGFVTGLLSAETGHVGAGARAGGYGGALGFVAFVTVGVVQSAVDGDISVLIIGFEALLIALVVVPIHALLGAMAASLGVRIRKAAGFDHPLAD